MRNLLLIAFAVFFIISCAEKPGGIFVVNEETIENFFEKDKQSWNPPDHLNLLIDQAVAKAEIAPVPQGLTRVYGVLTSDGPYVISDASAVIKDRGSTFKNSEFGMLGPAGHAGNAWFYADFNPQTGEIADARAYLYGFLGGVCDMRRPTQGSYGLIGESNFYLNINGPCLFPQLSGSTMDYALLIQGQTNLKRSAGGMEFPVQYIVDDSGKILNIPENPHSSPSIYDSGQGQAWINQGAQ